MSRKWHVDGSPTNGLKKIGYCSEEGFWTFQCPQTGDIFRGDRDDGGNLTRLTSTTSRPPAMSHPPAPSLPEDYEATLQRNLRATASAGGRTYVCPITGNIYDRQRNEPQALIPYQQVLPASSDDESSTPRDAIQPVPRSNPSSTSRDAVQLVPHRSLSLTSRSTVELPPRSNPSSTSRSAVQPAPRRSLSSTSWSAAQPAPRRNPSSTSRGASQPPPRRPSYQHVESSPPVLSPIPVRRVVPPSPYSQPPLPQPVSINEQHVTMQFYGQPINNIPPPAPSYYPGTYYYPSRAGVQEQGYLPPPPNPAAAPVPEPVSPASSAVQRPMRKRSIVRLFVDTLLKRGQDS